MNLPAEPPQTPAGEFDPIATYDEATRQELTRIIAAAPEQLRKAVQNLSPRQLDTRYRNWTIRQITHHIADSHLHVLIRFKWTLTEDNPTIKAYDEGDWANLNDAKHGDIEPTLVLLDGIHGKWIQVLDSMTENQFARTFFHPQSRLSVSLWLALNNYAWHSRHHTAQILWVRDQHGWTL